MHHQGGAAKKIIVMLKSVIRHETAKCFDPDKNSWQLVSKGEAIALAPAIRGFTATNTNPLLTEFA